MYILEEPTTPCHASVGTELPTDARLNAAGQLTAEEKKCHFFTLYCFLFL
jgi:hypothetical protein